eukprot:SAG31_NODE_1024_length_10294_cov_7.215400_7_plen_291_part_00
MGCAGNGAITVLAGATGIVLHQLQFTGWANCVASARFAIREGSWMVAVGDGGELQVWQTTEHGDDALEVHPSATPLKSALCGVDAMCCALSDGGNRLAVGTNEGEVLLWDSPLANPERPPVKLDLPNVGSGRWALWVAFSPDQTKLAVAIGGSSNGGGLAVWNVGLRQEKHQPDQQAFHPLVAVAAQPEALAWVGWGTSIDDQELLLTASAGKTISAWELKGEGQLALQVRPTAVEVSRQTKQLSENLFFLGATNPILGRACRNVAGGRGISSLRCLRQPRRRRWTSNIV